MVMLGNPEFDPLISLCCIVHNFEIPTGDLLKNRLDKSILMILICMGKSIRTKILTHYKAEYMEFLNRPISIFALSGDIFTFFSNLKRAFCMYYR